MAEITLTRDQATTLVAFCAKHKLEQFFIAKDQGAYVGASVGPAENQKVIYYFKGCNPKTDKGWWDNQQRKFGGDDFGEHMPLAGIKDALAHPEVNSVRIRVTATSIRIDGMAPSK